MEAKQDLVEDTPPRTISAVIIDDHPAVVSGVADWCAAAEPPVNLLDAEGRLARVYTEPGRSADVVILDLQLNGGPPVYRELIRLVDEGRRVVVYSHHADAETALHCLELGAATYLTKAEGKEHLLPAVQAVAADQPYAAPSLSTCWERCGVSA
jgi:DNA-binding NarL/FixJ family response regulator